MLKTTFNHFVPMSNPESTDSPQVKLLLEWDEGFQKKDLALISKPLHKDFRHITYPRSLNKPVQTREQWLEYIKGVINLWTDREASAITQSLLRRG